MVRFDSIKTESELNEALACADDIFFENKNHFKDRYPHVLKESNFPYLFACWEEEKLLSFCATYPATLETSNYLVRTAALGIVCTVPNAQGKGYSTQLINYALESLKEEGIQLVMISGEGKLYQRLGAVTAGRLYEMHMPTAEINQAVRTLFLHKNVNEHEIDTILNWASSQACAHFIRSREEWKHMIMGHLNPFINEENFIVLDEETHTFVAVRTGYEGLTKIAYLVDGLGTELNQIHLLNEVSRRTNCYKAFARLVEKPEGIDEAFIHPITITGTLLILNSIDGMKDIHTLFEKLPSFRVDNFNFL